MGKGRGPASCGACSCGICCAVFILLAGVVTWACVWGIEYNPNVNVKTLDLDLREIRVNIYNRNLYATEFSDSARWRNKQRTENSVFSTERGSAAVVRIIFSVQRTVSHSTDVAAIRVK